MEEMRIFLSIYNSYVLYSTKSARRLSLRDFTMQLIYKEIAVDSSDGEDAVPCKAPRHDPPSQLQDAFAAHEIAVNP